MVTKRRFLSLFIVFLLSGCAASQVPIQNFKAQYSELDDMKKAIANAKVGEKIYLLFGADWCEPCDQLKKLLEQEKIAHKVIMLDVDRTWAFLISRDLNVQGLPTLVVLTKREGKRVTAERPRFGASPILVYLLAHL